MNPLEVHVGLKEDGIAKKKKLDEITHVIELRKKNFRQS